MKAALCLLPVALLFPAKAARAQGTLDGSTGALAPPPAIEPGGAATNTQVTQEDLDRAEREDAGRGLTFFWVNGEVGFEAIGLQTFHSNNLVDGGIVESTQNGVSVGGGLGVRLIFLTVGARFRLGAFESWQLWTLNAELGLRIPLGALEPYFTFGGGYASLGSVDTRGLRDALATSNTPNLRGFDIRGGVGIDYFVGGTLSVGANLSGDLLFLSRPRVSGVSANAGSPAAARVYAEDGSGIGGATTLSAVVGLHF